MCDYCGCAGVPAVGELIAEHAALLEESHRVKAALRAGDRDRAHHRTPTVLGEPGEQQTAADCMVTTPTTLDPDVTVGAVRAAFRDDHLHMVLLTRAGALVGTLVREDLLGRADHEPARPLARLARRTVAPSASAHEARHVLVARGERRLAVVDADGTLLGLLCLKRHGRGFCSDLDVRARVLDRDMERDRDALSCA